MLKRAIPLILLLLFLPGGTALGEGRVVIVEGALKKVEGRVPPWRKVVEAAFREGVKEGVRDLIGEVAEGELSSLYDRAADFIISYRVLGRSETSEERKVLVEMRLDKRGIKRALVSMGLMEEGGVVKEYSLVAEGIGSFDTLERLERFIREDYRVQRIGLVEAQRGIFRWRVLFEGEEGELEALLEGLSSPQLPLEVKGGEGGIIEIEVKAPMSEE